MQARPLYSESLQNPDQFWLREARKLSWFEFPQTGSTANPDGTANWFPDGSLNLSYLCLDYHVLSGNGDQVALVYDSPVSSTYYKFTYQELRDQVARFAAGLIARGVKQGDTVVIYMPMIPQAVIAMLACVRIGAIHSVVFGGFAPHELAVRINDCRPKVLITASFGIEIEKTIPYLPLVKKAVEESAYKPPVTIIYKRHLSDDSSLFPDAVNFNDLLNTSLLAGAVALPATHPSYILYTSGTTGKPKGIVRDTGGYATALRFSMQAIYNVKRGDVFFAASDLGWVVGHSYIVYGPLLTGCTTVLYEGKPIKTPDAGTFWRLTQDYKINVLFAAPTAFRAIRKEDPDGTLFGYYDTSSLRSVFLAGERCDVSTRDWIRDLVKRPVIDHWWQTESGWPMLGLMTGIERFSARPGSAGLPVCGYDIRIVGMEGGDLEPGEEGLIAIKLPLPPGFMKNLWNQDTFYKSYLAQVPGYYLSGDGGYTDREGYFYVTGRVDDVINIAGHRLSTGEMEEITASHSAVAECAVVAVSDELKGQLPVAFVVLKDWQVIAASELEKSIMQLIREKIGAVASLKEVHVVKRLPKTRSGKILRKTLRAITDGLDYTMPSTIEDPVVLDEILDLLRSKRQGDWSASA